MNENKYITRFLDGLFDNAFLIIILVFVFSAPIFGLFEKWTHSELVELVAVLATVGILGVGLLIWRRVRLAQTDAAVKQSMLQRGLTADEMERLLTCQSDRPSPRVAPQTEAEAVEELGLILHNSGVTKAVIEEVFLAVSTAEPLARPVIYSAIRGMAGEDRDGATDEEIIAVLRGLRGPVAPPAPTTPTP